MSDDQNQNISIGDLQVMVNIIDACTKRGAFQGDEILPVGQLREKIVNFVKANLPPEESDDEAKTDEAAD